MPDPKLHPLPKVTPREILIRGLRCQCPNCGCSKLFRTIFKIHHRCPNCEMTLERGDGFYLGPLCINYGLIAFFFVTPLLIAGFAQWIPLQTAMGVTIGGAFLLPILLYRLTWSWWLMLYYLCLPDELHANRPEGSGKLSFEEEQRF